MLITNLGRTRIRLLASFGTLTDEQLNTKYYPCEWTVSQIVHHLYIVEKNIATDVLSALGGTSEKVAEKDLSYLRTDDSLLHIELESHSGFMTKQELIRMLEESRFRYLQRVFNETHERILVDKSTAHPLFGKISLKNLVDCVWLHEQYHTIQIENMSASFKDVVDSTDISNVAL
ncbi:DinB family protein [Alcaligenaceae bacterium CGII-47]|nr:DinB family protein [Alcaligenaceae bacterium CGII-47]